MTESIPVTLPARRTPLRVAACLLMASLFLSPVLAPAAEIPTVPERADWSGPAAAWWSHVQFLADDRLEGRKTGTTGYEKAVAYVEGQFQAAGLKPAGTKGFQQPVALVPTTVDEAKSSAVLKRPGGDVKLDLPMDASLSAHTADRVSAPMVFVGYGLKIPRKHVDDYQGSDVHGKVVVLYNAAPEKLQGPQRAFARGMDQRWKVLKQLGAVGVMTYAPPRTIPGADKMTPAQIAAAQPQRAQGPQLIFADPQMDVLEGLQLSGSLTKDGFSKVLNGTGHNFDEIKALGDAGKPMPNFAIPGTIEAHAVVKREKQIFASNVIGMLEGSDPTLRNEFVVVSAHLDHLGIGKEINGDKLYNGAMDNASGIASLIECAKLMAGQPHPKRSVLFIALMGEELGELGSQYFATKPTVPKDAVVGDLNMDMYLPLFPLRFLEVQGLGESTLGNDARAVCQLNDVEVQFDKQPDENRFVRSDQVNFVKQGIPALAFKFGWTPDSPEEKTFNDWVKTRYHKPSDDLNQPVDKVAAAQFTVVLAQLTTRVADASERPSWYPESSFATATSVAPSAR